MQAGDKVTIINCTLGGRYFIEHRAAILKRQLDDDDWIVAIPSSDGHNEHVQRYVDPLAQADPDAYLARLNDPIS